MISDRALANPSTPHEVRRGERGETLRLASAEFLFPVTLSVAAGTLALAAIAYAADLTDPAWLRGVRRALSSVAFHDSSQTADLLQTIAATLVTVTSIVFSLLLVAVQATAQTIGSQALDQFVRRRTNQVGFGFFVGLAVAATLGMVTPGDAFNPVLLGAFCLVGSAIAAALLLVLLYATVNQMRPTVILESIHDHTVEARARQLPTLIDPTRRELRRPATRPVHVQSGETGYATRIDLDGIQEAIDGCGGGVEVELGFRIGSHVAYGDVLARIHSDRDIDIQPLADAVDAAVRRERHRTIDAIDPAYGFQQFEDIGWSAISSARHSPMVGRLVIGYLRDILVRVTARWGAEADRPRYDIVYHDDVLGVLVGTLESLIAVTSESHAHHAAAEILDGMATVLPRLPEEVAEDVRAMVRRAVQRLDQLPATRTLEQALERMSDALEETGHADDARRVREAHAAWTHRLAQLP